MLRAFHCFNGSPSDGSLLVIAESRNRAKYLASKSVWEWPYSEINARLANPVYDAISDRECVIETNDELPPNVPPFTHIGRDIIRFCAKGKKHGKKCRSYVEKE